MRIDGRADKGTDKERHNTYGQIDRQISSWTDRYGEREMVRRRKTEKVFVALCVRE